MAQTPPSWSSPATAISSCRPARPFRPNGTPDSILRHQNLDRGRRYTGYAPEVQGFEQCT